MNRITFILAATAAIAVAAIGFTKGTYAAGGSDSSCYALMAEAFASGHVRPTSVLVQQVPWPDASKTFAPGGFVPSDIDPSGAAPICAPGFSLLLAPVAAAGGLDTLFWVTPLAGALLAWMGFLAGRALGGPLAGAMSAVLIAVSPAVLYQVVQPMNDITTAALWMATFVALIQGRRALAGVFCGLALLVRPNLLPLALIAIVFAGLEPRMRDWGFGMRRVGRFAVGAIPFVALILLLNDRLYGSPLRTGYGQPGDLFGVSFIPINAARYLRWLVETHTLFPLLSLAAPLVVARERRKDVWLAIGLIVVTGFIYFTYTPFDDWSYLRFLLPAIVLMIVLASATTVSIAQYVVSGFPASSRLRRVSPKLASIGRATADSPTVIAAIAITIPLAVFCVRAAGERQAFALQFLEQRYRSAGIVVRDHLPPDAVVLSVWDSGAVRFHGRKEALSWEALDPMWLDRSLQWLESHGHMPYILLESWEEPGFRSRFGRHSDIGKLDWPPRYEVDRVVRIYDPHDRARYDRGDRIDTEFLWPLRD
jgi:hypothetical protein